jgi:hypothetical protein
MAYTTDKEKLTVSISAEIDTNLRLFAIRHGKMQLSEIVEAALEHCLDNPNFIKRLTK